MRSKYEIYYPPIGGITTLRLTYDDGILFIEGFNRTDARVVELHFCDILLVRILDEGMRLNLINDIMKKQALVLLNQQSELLTWLSEESLQTRDLSKANHYLVLIGEEIIDIVSLSEPVIREQNNI
ncbi:MAG: hypothetical protein PHI97_33880 [Desulfobulbus sp.]|nr:hypothetical protein [Desulfobulbus sp.]